MAAFSQTISLEGAEDILAKLKAIGEQGEQAFKQLKGSLDNANPALTKLSEVSNSAQKSIKEFANSLGQIGAAISPVSGSFGTLLGLFGRFAGPAGVLGAAGAVALFVKNAADSVVATRNAAATYGLAIDQLKALGRAAREAGVDQETLTTALNRLARQAEQEAKSQFTAIVDIAKTIRSPLSGQLIDFAQINKLKEGVVSLASQLHALFQQTGDPRANIPLRQLQQQLFQAALSSEDFRKQIERTGNTIGDGLTPIEKMDVAVRKLDQSFASENIKVFDDNLKRRDSFDIFLDLAEKIRNTPDGFQKAALAVKFFGRAAGPELVPVLNLGREGFEQIGAALGKYVSDIDAAKIKTAVEFKAALAGLEEASGRAGKALLSIFGPTLTQFIDATAKDLQRIRDVLSGNFSASGTFDAIKNDFQNFLGSAKTNLNRLVGLLPAELQEPFIESQKAVDALWDKYVTDGKSANDRVKQAFDAFPTSNAAADTTKKNTEGLIPVFNRLGDAAKKAGDAGKKALNDMAAASGAAKANLEQTQEEWNKLFNTFAGGDIAGRDFLANPAAGKLQDILAPQFGTGNTGTTISGFNNLDDSLKTTKTSADDTQKSLEGAKTAAADLGNVDVAVSFDAAKTALDTVLSDLAQSTGSARQFADSSSGIGDAWGSVRDNLTQVSSLLDEAIGKAQNFASSIQQAARSSASLGGGLGEGGGTVALARGGFVHGPGTSTSDSILARLSRGEFVINAAAVRHFGARFFAALNSLRMPKFAAGGLVDELDRSLSTLDSLRLPKFSVGGLVDGLDRSLSTLALPRFATGGLVAAGAAPRTPITLVINGQKIGGLSGSDNAVSTIKKAAALAQVSSGGRKPSWVR